MRMTFSFRNRKKLKYRNSEEMNQKFSEKSALYILDFCPIKWDKIMRITSHHESLSNFKSHFFQLLNLYQFIKKYNRSSINSGIYHKNTLHEIRIYY